MIGGLSLICLLLLIGCDICFDVLSGKMNEQPSDLKLTIQRPSGDFSKRHPQDWEFTVNVLNDDGTG
jgi:hypothetical protein